GELLDESRLPHAGLAEDGDEVRAPVADGAAERVLEQLELLLAADERRLRNGAAQIVDAQRAPRPDRVRAALQLERPGVLDVDGARSEPPRARAEHNLARPRGLLQPRGDVDRLARRERRLGVVDHDLARLDADARLEA